MKGRKKEQQILGERRGLTKRGVREVRGWNGVEARYPVQTGFIVSYAEVFLRIDNPHWRIFQQNINRKTAILRNL